MRNYSPTQYSPEDNERLRQILVQELERRGWSHLHASQQIGVSQQTINAFVRGINNAGARLVRAMEQLLGQTVDQMLGRSTAGYAPWSVCVPGWADAVEQARAMGRYRHVPEHVWRTIGSWSGPKPPRGDPYAIGDLAEAWYKSAPEEEIAASIEAETLAEIEAEMRREPGSVRHSQVISGVDESDEGQLREPKAKKQ